jgi:integrase
MSVHRRATNHGTRYDVRLRTPEGRSYKRTFRTRREAETFEAREIADRSRGSWIDPRQSAISFGEWAKQWQSAGVDKRPKTRAWYSNTVRLHLLPTFGTRPLGSIGPRDVQHFVNRLAKRYAPTTTSGYYSVLRAILNSAVQADLITRSPCRGINLPSPVAKLRRTVEPDEVHRLAEAIGPSYRAMVFIVAELGLRWGECAGLQVGDLDLLRRSVSVRRNLGEVRGTLIVGEPKTRAGHRTVAASEPLAAELAKHLRKRGFTATDPDAWVFIAPEGGPLRYSLFRRRVWLPAVYAAGLDGLTFHGLRHSAATAWVAAGVDVRTAQHRLGHGTQRLVLELYAHSTTAADRAAAELMGARLFGGTTTAAASARAMDAPSAG